MWIDTHCHLDAAEFDADRDVVVARARAAGVTAMVLPSVHTAHFAATAAVAQRYGLAYALGIHPLWIADAGEEDIDRLRDAVRAALSDPHFVAIGEIGLDYFVADADRARQQWFYREQLRIARDLSLPVILHVRRSADDLLKELRRLEVPGGIAHAFNGSAQQADQFIARGFRLGFGGAATYAGSLRIRRLAADLPAHAIVLETDAPDIPPQWLRRDGVALRNEPAQLPRIAAEIAALRGMSLHTLAALNRANVIAALPRLAAVAQAAA
ncbi:MAG: TatD family hydrolase [Sutterellaceae bacterium]|nr:TatD family hydrolase [Burkholderiaceae bacterium]MCX7902586.1 TatD family hydrolase [Burkholderiaceae bacterium]MDW8429874.1 TatD family hydrolase [Sutterellaceae bacterium]